MKFLFLLSVILVSKSNFAAVHSFGILGDAGVWNKTTEQVRTSLQNSKIENLILPGDNIYNPQESYENIWKNWSQKGFEFSIVAIGNHNIGYENEINYFKMPSEYYSKVIGPARFIVLNSDNILNIREQAHFLELELIKAKETFIFIVYHHPPFSLRHSWQERSDFHMATRPILRSFSKKVSAILVGHDHVASLVDWDSIPVILSGAVWESLKIPSISYRELDYTVKTRWTSQGGFFWTRLDIDSETKVAWINFVQVIQKKKYVRCSIRISPRPILMRENCSTSAIYNF